MVKILLGLLLVAAGAYWIFYGGNLASILGVKSGTALADLLVLVNGGVPLFVLLIGLFIIWLEWDEWKIEKELAAEERKRKR
jgi:hypothetical protein